MLKKTLYEWDYIKHERKQSAKNGSASILKHLDKRDVCNA